MNFLIQVSLIFFIVQCCEIECKPRHHFIEKRFHFQVIPLPFKPVTFVLEKRATVGKFKLKHHIHKRQIPQSEISPVTNEIAVTNVAIEDIPKTPEEDILDKKGKESIPEVIITSIIKPVENGRSFSFVLPVESEVVITPAEKGSDIIKESPSEVIIQSALIPKPEEAIAPLGPIIEPPPPPELKPIVENVVINNPIEKTVPPPIPVPILQNTNGPIINPIISNIPIKPFLYTDISQIPLTGIPYPAPMPVPIPEVIIPPLALPPPPVKEPPVIKEETPNLFVKGSRFVLYFGSMMLQMLTQLVNGRINLNQPLPPLPLPAVLPGMQ